MNFFINKTLLEITTIIEQELIGENQITFTIENPDLNLNNRSYKTWVNLAELHFCKILTPIIINKELIELTFTKLNRENSFHSAPIHNPKEKYGTESIFFTINKNDEPTFLHAYKKALESVKVQNRREILNLGINKGDEFELIEQLIGKEQFNTINFVGVDHSTTALNFAKKRFPNDNVKLYKEDINMIKNLHLPLSDLIISIGTLQSPTINYKPFLMSLVQEHLTDNGAFILGFPNSRWIDNELIYGAKAPNYPYSEMSLLYNDVIFTKKYLQQKKFRVTITGREYIFLTATRIRI
jgi:hypothetical protein